MNPNTNPNTKLNTKLDTNSEERNEPQKPLSNTQHGSKATHDSRRARYANRVVISGYYGYGNCGDEAVLMAIIHCLRTLKPDISIVVLSGNPDETSRLYDVEAVNRWNPLDIVRSLMSCGLLISGGGSLLQDTTSAKSLQYYLAIMRIAIVLRKDIMVYSQGIGPLLSSKSKNSVPKVLNRCNVITVRDKSSAQLLEELGMFREIHVTGDPVLALPHDVGISFTGSDNDPRKNENPQKPLLVAAIRIWKENSHITPVAIFLDKMIRSGWDVLLVAAHYPSDTSACNLISEAMSEKHYNLERALTASDFIALTSEADLVFSMRLHGLICAMAAGTPMFGLSYDPKVDAFMEQVELSRFLMHYDSFDSDSAFDLCQELMNTTQPMLQQQDQIRSELSKRAWKAAEIAIELIESVDRITDRQQKGN